MSEPTTGAYASGNSSGDDQSTAKQVAAQTGQAAGQAAADVKNTATEQAQRVGAEAKTQVRNVVGDARDKLGEQARTQNDRLVGTIRETAGQLDEMLGDRADSPATAVVSRVADGGRQLADYLDKHGPEGVLREVQDFARRRPGAFLATALAAGFVVGRLGKSVAKADPDAGTTGVAGKPATDAFAADYSRTGSSYVPPTVVSDDDYVSVTGGTDYVATGTGTPLPVEDDYTLTTRGPRP